MDSNDGEFTVGSLTGGGYDHYITDDSDYTESDSISKPKIMLMGQRRSGKSSIVKVVFHKMSPNETLFLESTPKLSKEDVPSATFIDFSIWDFPGQINYLDNKQFDLSNVLSGKVALIFVIDAQDDVNQPLKKLVQTITKAHKINPNINFEVFIHKVDGISDAQNMDVNRKVHLEITSELIDLGLNDLITVRVTPTSIYDHSIYEAFSKVVQKLLPQLPVLEHLLNVLVQNSSIEKAFLFDVISKIYIATDSHAVDMQSYELCCDMIDVVLDISGIYGVDDDDPTNTNAFDKNSSSVIKLNNNAVLYLKQINKYLALVCILRMDSFEKRGLINYNVECFKEAVTKVFSLSEQKKAPPERQSGRDISSENSPNLSSHRSSDSLYDQ